MSVKHIMFEEIKTSMQEGIKALKEGKELVRRVVRDVDGLCVECGKYFPDEGQTVCNGCFAYREHTSI